MLGFLDPIKGFIQFKKCLIDNTTFRLHYQYTFSLLILASLLGSAKQYFGDPIDCIVDGVPNSVFKSYCWIQGTFTLPAQLTGRDGRNRAHPGVGPYPSTSAVSDPNLVSVTEAGDEIRHAWYQWVVFVLLFQAVLCYLPHFLWKTWEGGKLSLLLQGLDRPNIGRDSERTGTERTVVVKYMVRNLRTHNLYVYKFIVCEFLNVINIIGQMYLMDAFFGGQFSTYGADVIAVTGRDMEHRVDPMAKVFPKMAKCTFHKYGPSGTIQNHDGLCILPINIINEKIYIFLWFWYLILICWTSVFFCFRAVTVFSRYSRYLVFCGRAKSCNPKDVLMVMKRFWFGDWFILMQLCKNMDPMVFHELVLDLRDQLESDLAATMEARHRLGHQPAAKADVYPALPKASTPLGNHDVETP